MRFKNYIEKIVDNRGKNPEKYFSSGKYPVLDNYLIKNELYPNLKKAERYIDENTFRTFLRDYTYEGMVVMTLVGNGIGNVTTIPNDNVVIIQNTIGFKPVKEILIDKFLYYFFLYNQEKIRNFDRGSGQPSIKQRDILEMEVSFPSLEIQKKIANVLSAFDDKIELNNKINENLEQQAQAIFNKYFPCINIGNNFIGNYIKVKRGKNLLSKDAVLGKIPVVAGGLQPATYHNVSNTGTPVITISASGANAGYINLWHIPVWSSDSSFIDNSVSENIYFWLVLLKNRQQEIYDSQTGSAQPHIYPQHIENLPIGDIDKKLVTKYNKIVSPLFNLIGENKIENELLANLRNTLLPKLMNGEIDVNKI